MASALDVANYFLAASDAEDGLTNLKIQKLCAYAQAISLAYLEKPLFEEDIQAWKHGPVIPSVYESFKKHGRESIECSGLSTEYARCPFSDEQKLVLELVNEFYGQFSASALRKMSHDDFMGQPFGSMAAISQRSLVDMFKSNLIVERLNAKQDSCRFDPQSNRVISEEEFWDAL